MRGAPPPAPPTNIKNISQKWESQINVSKALIILKEIKKPSDKSLRVWAKTQLRFEIFEKILKFT